jgi:hypothetical protein
MLTFNEQGIDADIIKRYHELLPDAWKMTKSWWYDRLRYTLAKVWDCDQQTVAFSSWLAGRWSLSCAIEYHKESKLCTVTVNTEVAYGARRTIEERFAKALHIVLTSSNQVSEIPKALGDKTHEPRRRPMNQLALGLLLLVMGIIVTANMIVPILLYPVDIAAYEFLIIGIILIVLGLSLLTTSFW